MFRNIVKSALRNIKKRKVFSVINILGLAIGMTCCILILLWVNDELSYDRFHDNYQGMYRVAETQKQGDEPFPVGVTPAPLGPALEEEFPEIISSMRIQAGFSGMCKYEDKVFNEKRMIMADSTFFEFFNFELLMGDSHEVLSDPSSLVISQSIAEKYFGAENPVGKVMSFDGIFDMTVTGVFADLPKNTHLNFNMMVPLSLMETFGYNLTESWGSNSYYTYVELADNISYLEVNSKIAGFLSEHDPGYYVTIHLQPLKDMHLKSDYTADWGGQGNALYVKIFSLIAIFILIIACINFMNLSLAQSPLRAREIGIRKSSGASRGMLIRQFLGESLTIAFLSLLIAIVLVEILLPYYNNFTGKNMDISIFNNVELLAGMLVIALLSGFIAGSYPAFVLSGFQPVKVLKGGIQSGKKGLLFRKILVITQFTLSIALIICTLVISKQVNLIRNINLGYTKENIIKINKSRNQKDVALFKEELLRMPQIISVTSASTLPTNIVSSGYGLRWDGMEDDEAQTHLVHTLYVGTDFFKTFDIKIKEGRAFSEDIATDTLNYICNSEVAKLIGEDDALGKEVSYYREVKGELVGIIEDFHFKSIHSKIEPLMISYGKADDLDYIFVRILPGDIPSTLGQIQKSWETLYPEFPFEYQFLDDNYNNLYKGEYQMNRLFNLFAILAIFISCLGLFGLVSYSTTCRIKEIGIRKVHGASIFSIIKLLSIQFTGLIIVAIAIAVPLAGYYMNKWLDNFAFRTEIGYSIYLIAGLTALAIAFVTLSYHTIRAALLNPIDAIHYE